MSLETAGLPGHSMGEMPHGRSVFALWQQISRIQTFCWSCAGAAAAYSLSSLGLHGLSASLFVHNRGWRTQDGGDVVRTPPQFAGASAIVNSKLRSRSLGRDQYFRSARSAGGHHRNQAKALKLPMPPGVGGFVAVMAFRLWRKLRSTVKHTSLRPVRSFLRRVRMLQLPSGARQQLLEARANLSARSRAVPKQFRKSLGEAASKLEDMPTFLFEVTLLAAQVVGGKKASLDQARQLAEGMSILFAAGRMHLLHQEGGGPTRLLGGDYLYAEGQWQLAELGCLPVIKLSTETVREFSDCALRDELMADGAAQASALEMLHRAFKKTGSFFATAAGGAAWLNGSPQETVMAMYRYGGELGCALEIVRSLVDNPVEGDTVAHELALQMATSARKVAAEMRSQLHHRAAARGLFRLARAVEAEALVSIASDSAVRRSRDTHTHESVLADMETFREFLRKSVLAVDPHGGLGPTPVPVMNTLGLQRDDDGDHELQRLIRVGLDDDHIDLRAPVWPKGGPKVALGKAMGVIAQEQQGVSHRLDSGELAEGAWTDVMRDEAALMLRSGGKRLRPALALLMAQALNATEHGLARAATLGAAVEVLHGGSLVHDDILDEAESRRGAPTLHLRRGERQAVLVGDYLFAVSSALIARLESIPTIQLMSKVIADFGRGELAQSALKFEVVNYSLIDYLAKSFHKTASLLAAACQSAAVLASSDVDGNNQRAADTPEAEACYRYGLYVGLAFQVVDDVLDFTESDETLGKPALADLKGGYVSAPVLLALQGEELAESQKKELVTILERKLSMQDDLDKILALIEVGGGVEKSKVLAKKYAALAVKELTVLPPTKAKDALQTFADFVVARTY
eukprot:CAMPEP_0178424238 /NCGR_PEP_ID=MMETSP0689_2-20121128/28106_1 /TAXON_ID=160604 /ORGANISM="Amphidinium massartii, Strain CS-259" /LENGTH=858 /DNA_ID=CAMNT_0020045867 /DNA_START=40 /DNA_END=2616 /DNA_ORIENTATION=+